MARTVYVPRDAIEVVYVSLNEELMYNEYEWEDALESVLDSLDYKFPSLERDYRWNGREGRIVRSNSNVEVGYSGYNNMVAWWVLPKNKRGGVSKKADNSATSISKALNKILPTQMGTVVELVCVFSNGEGYFRQRGDGVS